MLEPFTALSVASAVIEFVDFGSKIIIEGYGAYKSLEGATEEHLHIEVIASHLKDLSDRLGNLQAANTTISSDEAAIRELAQRCTAVAQEIISILEDLKVKNSSYRSWDAVRKALRSMRKADKIHKLENRLNDIKAQINTHLLNLIRDSQFTMLLALRNLEVEGARTKQDTLLRLDETKNELLKVLERQEQQTQALQQVAQQPLTSKADAGQKFQASFHMMAKKIIRMSQDVLDSLLYREMPMRRLEVKAAYSRTFQWIFQSHRTPFAKWLKRDGGVFWVTGKPGSEKSTFMKFLCDHDRTTNMLLEWAGQSKLVVASHFFWSAGYQIQRAQEGLFRSLLYQILKQCPSLIPEVCPRRWTESITFQKGASSWTRQELLDTLTSLVNRAELNARFCFLIDGLDEYEGDKFRLIEEFEKFIVHSSVKFCVSSRPWTVFKDAYGGALGRQLVMQELTRVDMEIYIEGELTNDTRFRKMATTDPQVQVLVRQIREKAQGVFLWVYLAVSLSFERLEQQG